MNRVAVLALLALGIPACHKPADPVESKKPEVALPPVAVETAPIEVRKMPRVLTLTGSIAAERESVVAANSSGRVVSAPVERGQTIKVGQILATVDSKNAAFSAAASAAQFSLAETQAEQAKLDCERSEALFKTGAIAAAERDRQMTQCKAQALQANAARAQAGLAARLAADTVIRAPFDGVVGERYVNVGEYVQPPTRVASVYVLDQVRISVSVPESAIGRVQQGQTLDVHVASWEGRTFPATVVYVSPALRPSTRDLVIEARAANADLALRPGMFATVALTTGEETLPTAPVEAIVSDGATRRLFLARDGKAFELVVRTGVTKDGRIALLEPLDDKTRVIVKPPAGLRDGAPIAEGKSAAKGGTAAAEKPL
jgi:membrane fusion protein (multidrug efflux system)